MPVVVVSTLTERDAEVTLRALKLSAVDFVATTLAMRDAGRHDIRLDEASWAMFGMPREAIAQGAAHAVLHLGRTGPALVERLRANAGAALHRV